MERPGGQLLCQRLWSDGQQDRRQGGHHAQEDDGALQGGHRHGAPQPGPVGIEQGDDGREDHAQGGGQSQGEEDRPPRQQLPRQEGHAAENARDAVDQADGAAPVALGEVIGQGDQLPGVDKAGQGGGDKIGQPAADPIPGPGQAVLGPVLRPAHHKAAADLAADGAAGQHQQSGLPGRGNGVLKASGMGPGPPADPEHGGSVSQQNEQNDPGGHGTPPLILSSISRSHRPRGRRFSGAPRR